MKVVAHCCQHTTFTPCKHFSENTVKGTGKLNCRERLNVLAFWNVNFNEYKYHVSLNIFLGAFCAVNVCNRCRLHQLSHMCAFYMCLNNLPPFCHIFAFNCTRSLPVFFFLIAAVVSCFPKSKKKIPQFWMRAFTLNGRRRSFNEPKACMHILPLIR